MKFNVNNIQIALIALAINNAYSNVIERRNAEPTIINAEECVKENNCGVDVTCIAKCYNVPNPDTDSILRTADCQRTCNAKFPDPYIDHELLIQCHQDCIKEEYFIPYSEKQKMMVNNQINIDNNNNNGNDNAGNDNAGNDNDNNNNNNADNNSDNNPDNNNNNINNNNNNNESIPTNNDPNNTDFNITNNGTDVNNINNQTMDGDDDLDDNHIEYDDEYNGERSKFFTSLLITELILVITILYLYF